MPYFPDEVEIPRERLRGGTLFDLMNAAQRYGGPITDMPMSGGPVSGGTGISLADMIPDSKLGVGLTLASMIPGGKIVRATKRAIKPSTYYHGSPHTFEEFDFSKSHPGSEHGAVMYLTDRPKEASKYGANVRNVEFAGQIFPDEAPLNKKLMNPVTRDLKDAYPAAAASIDAALERIRQGAAKGGYTNDLALQELRQALPGDFIEQSNAINSALKRRGFNARSYREASGANTIAVFDPEVVKILK